MRGHPSFTVAAVLAAFALSTPTLADDNGVAVTEWLALGPVASPLPALADEKPGAFGVTDLLDQRSFPRDAGRPRADSTETWFGGTELVWTRPEVGSDGKVALTRPDGSGPATAWLAAYVRTDRFRDLKIELDGSHPRGVPEGLELSTDPDRNLDIFDVIDPPRVQSIAVSPDGKSVAAVLGRVIPGTEDTESWVEVRSTENGHLDITWRGFEMSGVAWAPDGDKLTYMTHAEEDDKKLGSLWLVSFKSGKVTPVLERVEGLGSYLWVPTGKAIVYSVKIEAEPDERGIKRLEGLLDRQADHRDKSHLYVVSVPDGNRRRLTAGSQTTVARDISPDGRRLLFTRSFDDPGERPYVRTELWEMDLETLEAGRLRDVRWLRSAAYSPDGKHILLLAGPSEFGAVGVNVPAGTTPNEYDGQLYVWDPFSDEVDALTVDFDPSVQQALWSRKDGDIYLRAEQGDFVRLFRCAPKKKEFTRIPARFGALRHLDVATEAAVAVVSGSAAWLPPGVARVDLKHDQSNLVFWPAEDWYAGVRDGTTEVWNFTSSGGTKIEGRVYLPPEFDASRKYPMIVYYYGGTSPTSRTFGGRYPKEYWASRGYVVYVLQPSGATGYGQAFSAVHVNDWGETVSNEIIEGVTQFLEAHPYVDPKRVGCIGASYGGFMTMLLVTKTDLFAAAISHAGISSLTSYWGEGYWGYSYSAVATAGSFPWNRSDIYRDRSPLSHADKVTTPILLTHGRSDTNVPVGESDSFYTALKLVGAPVEYIQVEGQDHFIMEHDKRVLWSRTIMAWFDRWLKDQPEWWNHLWPEAE
jgi:dipeptidyl aminopeptidase/acylaminoacyl peptidase